MERNMQLFETKYCEYVLFYKIMDKPRRMYCDTRVQIKIHRSHQLAFI